MGRPEDVPAGYLTIAEASGRCPEDRLISMIVHPGWAVKRGAGGMKISADDGAQTTLHCLLEDTKQMEGSAVYPQFEVCTDKGSQKGGWPMILPNGNVTPETAKP